jgi:hypothetical protein
MAQNLPVSRLVQVSVELTPVASPAPNLSTMLILGDSPVIDTVTRMMEFSSLAQVALYFSNNDPEYLAAAAWFGQSPTPDTVNIGRWAKQATHGQLWCGPLLPVNSLIATWQAVLTGSLTIAFDGGAVSHVAGLSFAADNNLNAVAATIQAGLSGGATCVYDANTNSFIFGSGTTGAASAVSFLTAGTTGVDITGMLEGLAADAPAAYQVPGLAAESALTAVELFDNQFAGQWYGLDIPEASASDFTAVATYIEGDTNIPHFFGQTSQDPECMDPASTTDIMFLAKAAAYTRSAIQFSSTSAYAIASFLARILTTNWSGSNTTITLMFKTEPGIVPENLSTTQANAIDGKNGNVYAAYNDGSANIQTGITPSGQYVDTVIGCDWLRLAIQSACYALLKQLPKIPQTDAGMHQLGTAIEGVCAQAVNNGLAAPGVWTGPGFGQLQTGQTLPKGYYVFVPPISSQSQADRQSRKSVPIQVAVKLAGAVQSVDVLIDVNP